MRKLIAMLLLLCLGATAAFAEPCIAKDGTCPQVVAPSNVFVLEEGETLGLLEDVAVPVVSEGSMLPWKNALIVGMLPKDAEIIASTEDAYGYAQTLLYDGMVSIVTARFGSVEARDAYMIENYMPCGEFEILADVEEIAGCKVTHIRYDSGENEDTKTVDAFYFADAENFFLFATAIPVDFYTGEDVEYSYSEFIPDWIASLNIWKE